MISITWLDLKQKASGIRTLSRRVENVYTPAWGESVAEVGEEAVEGAVLDGGVNKTAKGGARVRTGSMFDSAGEEMGAAGGIADITAGFIKGAPEHTIWQERGTRARRVKTDNPRHKPNKKTGKGIPAMLAIPLAIQAMRVEIHNSGDKMLRAIQADWNNI